MPFIRLISDKQTKYLTPIQFNEHMMNHHPNIKQVTIYILQINNHQGLQEQHQIQQHDSSFITQMMQRITKIINFQLKSIQPQQSIFNSFDNYLVQNQGSMTKSLIFNIFEGCKYIKSQKQSVQVQDQLQSLIQSNHQEQIQINMNQSSISQLLNNLQQILQQNQDNSLILGQPYQILNNVMPQAQVNLPLQPPQPNQLAIVGQPIDVGQQLGIQNHHNQTNLIQKYSVNVLNMKTSSQNQIAYISYYKRSSLVSKIALIALIGSIGLILSCLIFPLRQRQNLIIPFPQRQNIVSFQFNSLFQPPRFSNLNQKQLKLFGNKQIGIVQYQRKVQQNYQQKKNQYFRCLYKKIQIQQQISVLSLNIQLYQFRDSIYSRKGKTYSVRYNGKTYSVRSLKDQLQKLQKQILRLEQKKKIIQDQLILMRSGLFERMWREWREQREQNSETNNPIISETFIKVLQKIQPITVTSQPSYSTGSLFKLNQHSQKQHSSYNYQTSIIHQRNNQKTYLQVQIRQNQQPNTNQSPFQYFLNLQKRYLNLNGISELLKRSFNKNGISKLYIHLKGIAQQLQQLFNRNGIQKLFQRLRRILNQITTFLINPPVIFKHGTIYQNTPIHFNRLYNEQINEHYGHNYKKQTLNHLQLSCC